MSAKGAATIEEAAAIAAAIERFLRDTTPVRTAGGEAALQEWMRTALLEGVMRQERTIAPHPWINT